MLNFRQVNAVVDALIAALTDCQWQPEGGGAEAAFGEVIRYDANELSDAFSGLAVYKQRICLVVYLGESWETLEGRGRVPYAPVCRRKVKIALLVSDKITGSRDAASYGSDTTPGCQMLKDLALEAVAGPLFSDEPAVYVCPTEVTPISVIDTERNMPGRSAFEIDLECVTPWRLLDAEAFAETE